MTLSSERGVAFTEYAIALGAMVVIFIAASTLLYSAARKRAEESVGAVKNMAPCVENTLLNPASDDCIEDYTGKKCCYP